MFVGLYDQATGEPVEEFEWIINPGIDVPTEASDIHGFTTEYLKECGVDPHEALWEADQVFNRIVREKMPLSAYNANYDLSILTAEMARNKLGSRYGEWLADNVRIFDPLVVDRAKDRYRKGSRKLADVAKHYGIPFDPDKAHKADYDVAITAKVALAVARKYGVPSNEEQAQWYAEWAKGLQAHFRKADPDAEVNGDWPVRKDRNNEFHG